MSESEAEPREEVVEQASNQGNSMDLRDLLGFVERHHREEPGVDPALLERYIEATAEATTTVDGEAFELELEEHRTDAQSWVGPDAVYELDDGRLSAFPRLWHDKLDGETDLATTLAVIRADVEDTNEAFDVGGAGYGVPATVLLETVATLGGGEYTQAEMKLKELENEGVFEVDAGQHPQARVQFSDDARPDSLEAEEVEQDRGDAAMDRQEVDEHTAPDEDGKDPDDSLAESGSDEGDASTDGSASDDEPEVHEDPSSTPDSTSTEESQEEAIEDDEPPRTDAEDRDESEAADADAEETSAEADGADGSEEFDGTADEDDESVEGETEHGETAGGEQDDGAAVRGRKDENV